MGLSMDLKWIKKKAVRLEGSGVGPAMVRGWSGWFSGRSGAECDEEGGSSASCRDRVGRK